MGLGCGDDITVLVGRDDDATLAGTPVVEGSVLGGTSMASAHTYRPL